MTTNEVLASRYIYIQCYIPESLFNINRKHIYIVHSCLQPPLHVTVVDVYDNGMHGFSPGIGDGGLMVVMPGEGRFTPLELLTIKLDV